MDIALIGILSAAIVGLLFVLLSRRPADELPEHADSDSAGDAAPQAQPIEHAEPDAQASVDDAASDAESSEENVSSGEKTQASPGTAKTTAVTTTTAPAPTEAKAAPSPADEAASDATGTVETGADELESPQASSAAEVAPAVQQAQPQPPTEASPASPTPAESPTADSPRSALRKGLSTTRGGFISRLATLFKGRKEVDEGLLEDMEEVLITADIGVKTSDRILEYLREQQRAGKLSAEDDLWAALRAQAREILNVGDQALQIDGKRPALLMVVGVNGVGKTTTIGKLASKYQQEGRRVMLAAGDTFRAAAVPQLEVWAQRVGCPVVKGKEGADPGSVLFDAVKQAEQGGYDLVIADTAGRLHTKQPLMDELKKLERTATKALGGRAPDEILLVLDSTTGQNAVQQMYMFREALKVSGVVLTKLDGTAKGGVILGIVDEHKVPVRFIGLGEKVEDLREFQAGSFVDALFDKPDGETMAA